MTAISNWTQKACGKNCAISFFESRDDIGRILWRNKFHLAGFFSSCRGALRLCPFDRITCRASRRGSKDSLFLNSLAYSVKTDLSRRGIRSTGKSPSVLTTVSRFTRPLKFSFPSMAVNLIWSDASEDLPFAGFGQSGDFKKWSPYYFDAIYGSFVFPLRRTPLTLWYWSYGAVFKMFLFVTGVQDLLTIPHTSTRIKKTMNECFYWNE